MTQAEIRQSLRSDVPMVYVEAPAGCGKTHEAANLGVDLTSSLRAPQQVLLLAHTNAAVREFKSRSAKVGNLLHATTLDAFALEVVAPRAPAVGLPSPLRPGDGKGSVPFSTIMAAATEILRRAPTIAKSLGLRFPVAIFDEHQDASVEQHTLLRQLRDRAGMRIRVFADPMQAIFGFAGSLIDCSAVSNEADEVGALKIPQRWRESPDLGEWLVGTRSALRDNQPVPLARRPKSVELHLVAGLPNVHPKFDKVPYQLMENIQHLIDSTDGTLAILVPANAHCSGMRSACKHQIPIYEGSDVSLAHRIIEDAINAEGDAFRLSQLTIEILTATCIGFDKSTQRQLLDCLGPSGINTGRKKKIAALVEQFKVLYESPDIRTWLIHIASLPEALSLLPGAVPLRIIFPEIFRALGSVLLNGDGDYRDLVAQAIRQRRDQVEMPKQVITTIHKSKGHEFDHVVVVHGGSLPFPDNLDARKLLYVALSRARKKVSIIAPKDHASPLIGAS